MTGAALGGALAAMGLADASAKGACKAPNTKYGKGRNAVCCTPGQTYDASTNACVTPNICTPDCTGKCGGVSDGCTGTCDAVCVSNCRQIDCNTAIDAGDGTCWYTPDYAQEGAICHNLNYGVGDGVCDGAGNCVAPS
jgi:hypothetical protein